MMEEKNIYCPRCGQKIEIIFNRAECPSCGWSASDTELEEILTVE